MNHPAEIAALKQQVAELKVKLDTKAEKPEAHRNADLPEHLHRDEHGVVRNRHGKRVMQIGVLEIEAPEPAPVHSQPPEDAALEDECIAKALAERGWTPEPGLWFHLGDHYFARGYERVYLIMAADGVEWQTKAEVQAGKNRPWLRKAEPIPQQGPDFDAINAKAADYARRDIPEDALRAGIRRDPFGKYRSQSGELLIREGDRFVKPIDAETQTRIDAIRAEQRRDHHERVTSQSSYFEGDDE